MTALTSSQPTWLSPVTSFMRSNPLLVSFAIAAVGLRVLFSVVTHRTWEDALILDAVTRNFWLGNGLTHQNGEEPIQSYSSAIWMLFSLVGNSVDQGILFLKLVSIVATVATIWFAYSIASTWRMGNPGIILILGFLTFEQVHVTFGMAGMESQFATAYVLLGIWALIEQRPVALMLTATLAPLVRPELIFWSLLVVVIYLIRPRLVTLRAVAIAVPPLVAWVVFTLAYYGTLIPQTVTAKSLIGTTNVSRSGFVNGVAESLDTWERVAPYFSNYFASSAIISRDAAMWIMVVILVMFIVGWIRVGRTKWIWALPAFLVPVFVFYVGFFNVSNYHMWYVSPFSAVLFLYASAAFGALGKRIPIAEYAVSISLVVVYLVPAVSYFGHEAYVQNDIDIAVRQATGIKLNSLMNAGQTVVLEPLGFMGAQVTSGSTIDYPGLSSRVMTDALHSLPISERNMGEAVKAIQPNFVVVRQGEWESFRPWEHPQLRDYTLIASIGKPGGADLDFLGATYSNSDDYFEIYGR